MRNNLASLSILAGELRVVEGGEENAAGVNNLKSDISLRCYLARFKE